MAIASLPVVAVSTFMPRRSSTLRQREDIAGIVINKQHGAPDQIFVRRMQPLEHFLLARRQIGDDPMQEQRGFVEQALGRFDALDDDAARHRVQLRILLGRQFAPGEDDDRHGRQRFVVAHALQHLEARHVGQPQIEHDAIGGLLLQRRQRCRAGIDRLDVDVVVAEKLGDAELLGRIVLDDEQALAARFDKGLDAGERSLEPFGRRRLVEEGESAAREPVLLVVVQRDDLHRDVARRRVLLELAEHRPAEHVGQEHVERDRRRLVILAQAPEHPRRA